MNDDVHFGNILATLNKLRQCFEVAVARMKLGATVGTIGILNSLLNEI